MTQEPKRVFAILKSDEKTVYLFGFGHYVGHEVPPQNTPGHPGFMGVEGRENPKIVLDNGKVVWGCECWWGAIKEYDRIAKGREVKEVDIDELRKAVYENPPIV